MYKVGMYLLLPLMWINLTVSENKWSVFGLKPDQYIYGLTILLAWYIGSLSRYRVLVTMMLMFAIVMRLLEEFGTGELREIERISLAVVFAVAGAEIYGRNPFFLRRQLVVYLALCIPIMLLQILGVSSLLMGWNTEYLHDPNVLILNEIGTFKKIQLYPTLFVGIDKLIYSIGQARPVGLMYGNNPLSIFISIAVAINLAIARASRISLSDIVVTTIIALAMSKLVFGVAILLYIGCLIFGGREKKLLALKLMSMLILAVFLYCILFPGLFIANLSQGIIMISIMLRLMDILSALGIKNYFGGLIELAHIYRPEENYVMGTAYSSVAILLRSNLLVPILFGLIIGTILYISRFRRMISYSSTVYIVTLFTCLVTQFAIPFVVASSFQLIMGFALFPLFKKMWQPYLHLAITEPKKLIVFKM